MEKKKILSLMSLLRSCAEDYCRLEDESHRDKVDKRAVGIIADAKEMCLREDLMKYYSTTKRYLVLYKANLLHGDD